MKKITLLMLYLLTSTLLLHQNFAKSFFRFTVEKEQIAINFSKILPCLVGFIKNPLLAILEKTYEKNVKPKKKIAYDIANLQIEESIAKVIHLAELTKKRAMMLIVKLFKKL